jgi:hypothetical protein
LIGAVVAASVAWAKKHYGRKRLALVRILGPDGRVAKRLKLLPTQHTQEVFKQILSGAKSVVEGLMQPGIDLGIRTVRA